MAISIGERVRLLIGIALVCWMATVGEAQDFKTEVGVRSAWPSVMPGENAVTRKIRRVLDGVTEMDFEETPLYEAIDYLRDLHGIEIQLDARALDKVGIGSDTPVTARCRGISLRSGLNLMLVTTDNQLTFTIWNEAVLITTYSAEPAQCRVYNVAELLGANASAKELVTAVSAAIATPNSRAVQITPYGPLLIVSGDQRSHDQLAQLLEAMKTSLDPNRPGATRLEVPPTVEVKTESGSSIPSSER